MRLTIGVPTYNRAANVLQLLHGLLAESESELVEILVIDDGSDDGTYSQLSRDSAVGTRIRVLSNEANLGYAHTFARLIGECRTEYLMVVADDDSVMATNLPHLLEYLGRERPAFVSPQFLRGSSLYRGREATGPIAAGEFLSTSAHASGLIYRVDDCRDALAELAASVEANQPAAVVYPQVIVVMRLLIAGARCEWLALPMVREDAYEPSGIRDADGRPYWSLESRWQQLKSFDALLTQYLEQEGGAVAREMLDAHRNRVFRIIESAIASEDGVLGAAFSEGARRAYAEPRASMVSLSVGWLIRARDALRRRS